MLHKSRVMRLKGLTAPSFIRPRLRGWGFSIIEHLVRSINQYLKANNLSFEVLDEFKIDIFKIKNLADTLISETGESQVRKRVQLANWQKNYQHALIMDSEDDYAQKQLSFAGLADVMKEIRMQIASDMRMPLTKLFGISAAGFSSGEDDIENYNAMVESQVRNKAKYDILRVIEIKCQKLFGFIPDDLSITFKPLRMLSSVDEETVKTAKFNRLMQAKQASEISTLEFRDGCNRDKLLSIQLDTSEDKLNPDDPEIESIVLKTGVPADPDMAIDDGNPNPNKTTGPSIDDPGANREDTRKPRAWDSTTTQKKTPHGPDKNKTAVMNADFKESDHPRAEDGKFGSGGGASASKSSKSKNKQVKFETRKLDKKQKESLQSYKADSFSYVNEYLRKGTIDKDSDYNEDNLKKEISNIDSSISSSKLKEDTIVYRGIDSRKKIFKELENNPIGKIITGKTYWSTSPSEDTAKIFSEEDINPGEGVVFKINLKKGQNSLDMSEFDFFGQEGEPEILLPRDVNYKVVSIEKSKKYKYPIYNLEIVNENKESVKNSKKKWWEI